MWLEYICWICLTLKLHKDNVSGHLWKHGSWKKRKCNPCIQDALNQIQKLVPNLTENAINYYCATCTNQVDYRRWKHSFCLGTRRNDKKMWIQT